MLPSGWPLLWLVVQKVLQACWKGVNNSGSLAVAGVIQTQVAHIFGAWILSRALLDAHAPLASTAPKYGGSTAEGQTAPPVLLATKSGFAAEHFKSLQVLSVCCAAPCQLASSFPILSTGCGNLMCISGLCSWPGPPAVNAHMVGGWLQVTVMTALGCHYQLERRSCLTAAS